MEREFSLHDFSLINAKTTKVMKEQNIKRISNAFLFFSLEALLELQDDEIRDSITDSCYLNDETEERGRDRGIDAVYIDDQNEVPIIHLFNCKYTEDSNKSKKNNFPSGEIDKLLTFINDLMTEDDNLQNTNNILFSKVNEIWELMKKKETKFIIHICSNHYLGLEKTEKERFENQIKKYSSINFEYNLLTNLSDKISEFNRISINGKVRVIKKDLFDKAGGDIRALILNIQGIDLIRMILSDKDMRDKFDYTDSDLSNMITMDLLPDAFEENVRIYLKQRSRINRNIKKTALSDNNSKFFYYNNGITIICKHYSYGDGISPILILEDIQVVNGSQTIYSLYEAFKEEPSKLKEVSLLCRIYEIKENKNLSANIAEYTNSQNPVKSRDIRSIDFVQQKLEDELKTLGYFYERKKNQYANESKEKRIDSEKAGQTLMAFYNEMPIEARANKSIIFGDKYEEVFAEEMTGEKLLLSYILFNKIEQLKNERTLEIENDKSLYEEEHFILYSSYFILFILKKIAEKKGIKLELTKENEIMKHYNNAINIIKFILKIEKEKNSNSLYTTIFKLKGIKYLFDSEMIEKKLIENYL